MKLIKILFAAFIVVGICCACYNQGKSDAELKAKSSDNFYLELGYVLGAKRGYKESNNEIDYKELEKMMRIDIKELRNTKQQQNGRFQ